MLYWTDRVNIITEFELIQTVYISFTAVEVLALSSILQSMSIYIGMSK